MCPLFSTCGVGGRPASLPTQLLVLMSWAQGPGFRVQGFSGHGPRVQGSEYRGSVVMNPGFRVQGSGGHESTFQGSECRGLVVMNPGPRVQGPGVMGPGVMGCFTLGGSDSRWVSLYWIGRTAVWWGEREQG